MERLGGKRGKVGKIGKDEWWACGRSVRHVSTGGGGCTIDAATHLPIKHTHLRT
jgi:hypothetical protein